MALSAAFASAVVSRAGRIRDPRRLEQEPGALLGLIRKPLDEARRRDVAIIVAGAMRHA